MATARNVTLIIGETYDYKQYSFVKNRPVPVSNAGDLEYFEANGHFRVEAPQPAPKRTLPVDRVKTAAPVETEPEGDEVQVTDDPEDPDAHYTDQPEEPSEEAPAEEPAVEEEPAEEPAEEPTEEPAEEPAAPVKAPAKKKGKK